MSIVSNWALSLALAVCLLSASVASAAVTAEQQREIRAMRRELGQARNLVNQDQMKASGKLVRDIQARFDELAETDDEEVVKALGDVYERLSQVHALLEVHGVELDPLFEPGVMDEPTTGSVSFVDQVAPLLNSKCGGCHVRGRRGEFRMANYTELMRGSSAGTVVFPGDADGSRIIELIESGDMPRGGTVSDDQLAMLKKWIIEGAKFDGEDQNANLASFSAGDGDMPTVQVRRATGSESVSFALDIAPVLLENCNGCHINAQRARGRFNMTTFAGLLRAGDSEMQPVTPGNPETSNLIQRLKTDMPMGRDRLPDEVIAKFEKWVSEGAKFDGPESNMPIRNVAALAKAKVSTHDELSQDRVDLANDNWRLCMGNSEPKSAETKNFFVIGNVPEADLKEYGERAEKLAPRVATLFGAKPSEPLIKGRMTLYVFQQRYDYSEFGQMIEERDLPKQWRGHWNFTIVDAYGALVAPRDDSYSLDALVAQQLAGAYIASLNDPPGWFSEGMARVAAARVAPKDARVKEWNDSVRDVIAEMSKADDFLTGKMSVEEGHIAAYSYGQMLASNRRSFGALMDGLRKGTAFNTAFSEAYTGSPTQGAEYWWKNPPGVRRRR